MIALQLPRGKQVPQCLWVSNIWSSNHGSLWEQEISSFCPSFQFLCCKEQVGVTNSVFTIHSVGQHVSVFRVQALIETIAFHLLHMLLVNPSWIPWLEYLNMLQQVHPEFGHILPRSLFEGIELLAKGVECHHHSVVFVQCLQDISQGSILT